MGKQQPDMKLVIVLLAAAFIAVSFAGEVEDLGAQAPTGTAVKATKLGEAARAKAGTGSLFSGSLMTSGSFTMMASGGMVGVGGERDRDKLGEANDWDLTNGGQCD